MQIEIIGSGTTVVVNEGLTSGELPKKFAPKNRNASLSPATVGCQKTS